jgi:hypothetical protein
MARHGASNICQFYDKADAGIINDLISEDSEEVCSEPDVELHDNKWLSSAFKRAGKKVLSGIHDLHELYDDFSDDDDSELQQAQLTEEHIPSRIEKVVQESERGSARE